MAVLEIHIRLLRKKEKEKLQVWLESGASQEVGSQRLGVGESDRGGSIHTARVWIKLVLRGHETTDDHDAPYNDLLNAALIYLLLLQ